MNTKAAVVACVGMWMLGVSGALAQNAAPGAKVADGYIVTLKAGVTPSAVAGRLGVAEDYEYSAVVNGFAARLPAQALARVLQDDEVEFIVEDRQVVISGKPSGGGTTVPQEVPAGILRIGATNLAYTGSGIGVAVVDTGIDLANKDLLLGSKSFSAVSRTASDDHGHGTHVAGIIAALNNTIDVVGVAPQARVYAVKVLDSTGNGTDSSIIAGLDWVAQNAASVSPAIRVVNMSLGRPGTLDDNPVLRQAVQALVQMGITVVVSAGNDQDLEVSQTVPSTYPEVIAVASTTAKDGLSSYPGFNGILTDTASYFTTDGALAASPDGAGYIGVTISAPGEDQEDVGSTGAITPVGLLSLKVGGGTTRLYGTSMAAPHVAGVAALLQQKFGGTLTPEAVRAKIANSADNLSAPYDNPIPSYTFDGDREGILSAPGALAAP